MGAQLRPEGKLALPQVLAARVAVLENPTLVLPTTVYGVACLAPELLLSHEPIRSNWDVYLWPALRRWCVP